MFYPFSASLGVYNFSQLPIDFLFTDYSLIIRDPEEQKSGYSTAGSVSESVGAVAGQEILEISVVFYFRVGNRTMKERLQANLL